MLRLGVTLLGTATVVAAVDLMHKASTDVEAFHPRSPTYVVLVLGLTTLWTGAILATRSLLMALGGGVLLGGATGNVISVGLWAGVPNPIVLGSIAFNLADSFVLVGFLVVAVTALTVIARSPERLREPVHLR